MLRDLGHLSGLVELVLPRSCLGCGRPGPALCPACGVGGAGGVGNSVVLADLGVPAAAAAHYDGALRQAVLRYKERGRRDLTGPLGSYLARALLAVPTPPGSVLVPVPSSASMRRSRGGDHLLPLARVAGRAHALPVVEALTLVRAVADSAGLGLAQRAANIDTAMRARCGPRPGSVAVVVDDVVTTGATVREAVRALRSAGWTVTAAAVLAATPAPGSRAARQPTG